MAEKMIMVMTTYPNKHTKKLKNLVHGALKQGMSSCVQQQNYIKSTYIREGKIKKDHEKVLIFKTLASKKEKLVAYIEKNHPYEIPFIATVTPDEVNELYLNWMQQK